MKPYPKYKPSGIEWIGDIPEKWESLKIKYLSVVKRGASPRPIDDPKYFDDNGEFAWVRIADLTASERYLENTTQTLSDLGSSLSVKRFPGDFFLSIAGTVGKPIITKIKCCIHDGFVYFPNLKVNPEFLYYIFSTGLPYQGLGKWGTQINLNTETVGDIYLPIPKDNEIGKIVNYLDTQTAKIDKLISNKQHLIELLKEERTAIINHAVTKGINPKASLKPSGIEWLGDIPKHWEVKKLKYVAGVRNNTVEYADFKLAVENIESHSGKLVNLNNLSDYEGELAEFVKGDVLFNKLRPYLHKVYLAENNGGCYGELLVLFSLGELVPEFLFYMIFSSGFIQLIDSSTQGTKMPRANWNDFISQVFVCYPPIEEQTNIITVVKSQTSKIDTTISKIEQEINLMQEYRTALISEVVTGKVMVV